MIIINIIIIIIMIRCRTRWWSRGCRSHKRWGSPCLLSEDQKEHFTFVGGGMWFYLDLSLCSCFSICIYICICSSDDLGNCWKMQWIVFFILDDGGNKTKTLYNIIDSMKLLKNLFLRWRSKCQNRHLHAKLRYIECLSGIVGNVGCCDVDRGRRRTVDGEIEQIRVVQIVQIHIVQIVQIHRQIHRDVSPAAGLMVVIQAKHDGESWKVKLKERVGKWALIWKCKISQDRISFGLKWIMCNHSSLNPWDSTHHDHDDHCDLNDEEPIAREAAQQRVMVT